MPGQPILPHTHYHNDVLLLGLFSTFNTLKVYVENLGNIINHSTI